MKDECHGEHERLEEVERGDKTECGISTKRVCKTICYILQPQFCFYAACEGPTQRPGANPRPAPFSVSVCSVVSVPPAPAAAAATPSTRLDRVRIPTPHHNQGRPKPYLGHFEGSGQTTAQGTNILLHVSVFATLCPAAAFAHLGGCRGARAALLGRWTVCSWGGVGGEPPLRCWGQRQGSRGEKPGTAPGRAGMGVAACVVCVMGSGGLAARPDYWHVPPYQCTTAA